MVDRSSYSSLERHRAAVRMRLDQSGQRRPGPGSVSWKINGEMIVVAGWGRAILLLLAHPSIAAGVHEHSGFRLSFLARLRRLRSTVAAMQALTFGDTDESIAAAAAINTIHDRVKGRAGNASYSAHDPHLLRWVHAALVDSILVTYELLVEPLTVDERDRYCAEAAIMEPLLGMPARWLPRDSASLATYMRGLHGALVINDTSRTLARAVLFPPMWRALWPVFRALQVLALGTLPPGIRAAYGFEWRARDGSALARWTRGLRSSRRLLPQIAREWPAARRIGNRSSLIPQRTTAHMKTSLIGLIGLTVVLGGSPAYAQQDKLAEVDKIFDWVTPGTPGCSVAVAQQGKVVVNRAYGLADLERAAALTPDSVFDVASIVKQFVAAATLLLVNDGTLSLSDDVRKHVPELPDYGHTVTLDHLLTHTSGIRDWDGLMPLSNGKADALTLTLRQRGLNFAPGEEWSYSNSGYVLLKEIVARASGMSFAEFARTRLFEPIGMKSTEYLDDMRDVVTNRALAYAKAGSRWKLDMQLGNERGGGALLSTASDLIVWNDALAHARLGAALSRTIQEPARLNNGRKVGYARGLYLDINRAGSIVWHSGSAAGYRSALARFPESGLSVAILCNSGEGADSRTAFVRRIFDIFVPASATVNAEPAPLTARVEGLEVKSKAGLFFNERTGQALRLAADNGRLRVQGGPVLDALSPDRFRNPRGVLGFMSNDEFELRFVSHDAFELKSMEGAVTRYRRADPSAPTGADLKAFAGRYESDEIGGFFDIEPGTGGLIGRANDASGAGLPLRPVDRDTFQIANVYIRLVRDAAGDVVALDYSNPLVRNIRFTRVSDGKR